MQLEFEAKKLVYYINSLGLEIPEREPSHQHVGAIIADAVLQGGGHRYKTQVKPRVERIIANYPTADTISGLSSLLKTQGTQALLNWSGKDEQERFRQTVSFFENEQINSFDDLRKWLESDSNRDRLITKSDRVDKAGLAKIADATADYYRVLVRLPDAVKVDSRVKEVLTRAGINVRGYEYKELRTIVQLAAKQLGKRPLDLDSAIWNYQGKQKRKKEKFMGKGFGLKDAREFSIQRGFQKEHDDIEKMIKPGSWSYDIFKYAKRGNYLLMWQCKGVNYPYSSNPRLGWERYQIDCFNKYIGIDEGQKWLRNCIPAWVSQQAPSHQSNVPVQLTITLSPGIDAELTKLASDLGLNNATDVARILISMGLRLLR